MFEHVWTGLNKFFEKVWPRFVVDSTRNVTATPSRDISSPRIPKFTRAKLSLQRNARYFAKFRRLIPTLAVNTFARVKKAGEEGAIGGRKKRGIRLFTCKTTPEDTASYNSANVGSVGQRLCALAHGGVGNKSRWPVCPRIFRVTWNYFASLAKVARAPASIAAARFPRYCETPRFTTHHPSLNLAPIKTRSKASLLELLLTFVSDHAFVRLYLRFVVHLSGETVDGGAKKFAPLIAFGVNQELLLSSGWKLLLEAKLRVKIRVGE